jgi:hypothetical protein
MNDKETTDWGDEWVEPDVRKRFGIPERKPGTGCFVAGAVIIAVALLAYVAYWIIQGL